MPGLNPYVGFNQQQRMASAYGGGSGYPGGGGYGSRYGMNSMMMRPPAGAVTGPTGSSSGSSPGAYEDGKAQMEAQQQRQQGVNADLGAYRQGTAAVAAADQVKSIADYRQARDTGIGRDNENTSAAQRTQATDLGIDPSSDATEIAAAASGKVQPGANGRMAGGDTGNGSLAPNSTDVATAAAAAQAAKTGAQVATTNQAYINGANPRGQAATGAAPFTQGIAPKATPNLTTRPMVGVPAQPATQPIVQPPVAPVKAAVPATGTRVPPVGPFPIRPRKTPMQTVPLATT